MQRAVGIHRVPHHNFALVFPVAYIEVLFVGREGNSIRSAEVARNEANVSVLHREHAFKWEFFAEIVVELWQSERRICDVEYAIGTINKVVGTIESLPFEFVDKNGLSSICFHANHASIPVLVDREPTLGVQSQAI